MPAPYEWAFDVQAFFLSRFGDKMGFDPDDLQRYPDRLVGTLYTGTTQHPIEARTVVLFRPTTADYAETYRHWVTLNASQFDALGHKPKGWSYLICQIGMQPDGSPYWATLYDEGVLAAVSEHAQRMPGFIRFDPGLTGPAVLAHWTEADGSHFDQQPMAPDQKGADVKRTAKPKTKEPCVTCGRPPRAYEGMTTPTTVAQHVEHIQGLIDELRRDYDHGPARNGGGIQSSRSALLAVRQELGVDGPWEAIFKLLVARAVSQ